MFTLVAFSEVVGILGGWDNINAVPDQHVKTQNEFIYIGDFNRIVGEKAYVGTSDWARLLSPSLRAVNPEHIQHLEAVEFPAGNCDRMFHPEKSIPLIPNEALECEIYNNPGTVTESVIVALAQGGITPITGDIRRVYFHCTPPLAEAVWAFSEIIVPDGLPVGNYAVVGCRLHSATSTAFRFVPVGGFARPGGLCVASELYLDPFHQHEGRLGEWFTFNTVQLPGIEVLDTAATGATNLHGWMDLIRK